MYIKSLIDFSYLSNRVADGHKIYKQRALKEPAQLRASHYMDVQYRVDRLVAEKYATILFLNRLLGYLVGKTKDLQTC